MTETIDFLTGWLKEPYVLSEEEKGQLGRILEKYPYFVPARYAAAGSQYHEAGGFSKELLHEMQLY